MFVQMDTISLSFYLFISPSILCRFRLDSKLCKFILVGQIRTREESFLDLSLDIDRDCSISSCLRSVNQYLLI